MRGKKRLFSSIRARLIFIVCLVTFPVLLFTFFLADRERVVTFERTKQDALHLARLASREHAHQIKGARNLLHWLGTKLTKEGKKSLIITDPDFLPALLAGHPQLANVGVLAPDGQVLTSAYPLVSPRSWKDNPVFSAALKSSNIVVGTYTISPIFDRPTLNHTLPIRDSGGKVWAVLFNGLNLEWLSEMARQAEPSQEISLLIADREGHILAQGSDPQIDEKNIATLQILDVMDFSPFDNGKITKIPGTHLHRYLVALPLEESSDLYVVASLPYEKVFRQAGHAFYRMLAILGIITVFTVIVVFLATEISVLRILRSLASTVQRFGAGDLSARAKPLKNQGDDELAYLHNSFNTMADSLSAKYKEISEAQTQMRALAGKLQKSKEIEAARISRELHDEIGQTLTSFKIDLSRLQSHCGKERNGCAMTLKNEVETIKEKINDSIDLVRRISSELRPNVLDKLGLVAALEWLASEIQARTQLAVQIDVEGVASYIHEAISITLFRITQEALTNVIRHAQATLVEIKIIANRQSIALTIKDNGNGIMKNAKERPDSLGIIGMRERAIAVNGHFTIHSESGQGTLVNIVVPLQPIQESADANLVG